MAKKKKQSQEIEQNVSEQKEQQLSETSEKDTRVIYAGPTIVNEKFFLRKGQIFTEIPRYAPDELKKFFVPVPEYSPEKEKELEEERKKYLKSKKNR